MDEKEYNEVMKRVNKYNIGKTPSKGPGKPYLPQVPGPQVPGPSESVPPKAYEILDKIAEALEKIVARLDDLEHRMNQRCHCGEVALPGDYLCGRCRDECG